MSLPETSRASGLQWTWDVLFEVLSSARRRRLLSALVRRDEMRVSAAIDHVAAVENDVSTDRVTTSQTTPVRTSMYHVHLPALDEAGLVSWKRDSGTISLAEEASGLPLFTPVEGPLVDQYGPVSAGVVRDGE